MSIAPAAGQMNLHPLFGACGDRHPVHQHHLQGLKLMDLQSNARLQAVEKHDANDGGEQPRRGCNQRLCNTRGDISRR